MNNEVTLIGHKHIHTVEDGKNVYRSVGKINGYEIELVFLNEPNGKEKTLKAIKKFFEKEIF